MVFSVDKDGVTLSQGDHNQKDRTFTLRSIAQANIPLNEYFFLKIRGLWRISRTSSDTAEFYMIYACRFVSKLIVTL